MKEDYEKAGKIAHAVLEEARKVIKPGASLLEACEEIEKSISEKCGKDGGIAFPCNIGINNVASHYTAAPNEKTLFTEKDVVIADVGAHINGYIGDAAITIDLSGEYGKLTEASERALENAISMIKPGVHVGVIGAEIQRTIESYGYKPIRNLSGHGLAQYKVHSEPTIPNVKSESGATIREGMIFAIEPFATTGSGFVKEDTRTDIFSFEKNAPARDKTAREIMKHCEEYGGLPFAERWLAKKFPEFKLRIGLRELINNGAFRSYPVLKDVKNSLVSQAEHTVIVEKDSAKVTT